MNMPGQGLSFDAVTGALTRPIGVRVRVRIRIRVRVRVSVSVSVRVRVRALTRLEPKP